MSTLKVKPLTKELEKVAREELNEKPEHVEDDLKSIKEWIRQQPHLNARTDDQWLLAFLRSSKFSLERAKSKIDSFYTLKTAWPNCMTLRDPFSRDIQDVLKSNFLLPLPQLGNSAGPLLIFHTLGTVDFNVLNLEAVTTVGLMLLSILMVENDNFVVTGVVFIHDCKNARLSNVLHLTPTYLRNLTYGVKAACCCRIKGMHMINLTSDLIANVFKSMLPKKIKERFHVYSTENQDKLYEHVPQKYLPKEYGGENGTIEELGRFWKAKIESYADCFKEEEDRKYGVNESLRINERPYGELFSSADEGSFRKLNID